MVSETLKFELALPSKFPKGKLLVFIKLKTCALTAENIRSNVSIFIIKLLIFIFILTIIIISLYHYR